jgi:hypothetical protein
LVECTHFHILLWKDNATLARRRDFHLGTPITHGSPHTELNPVLIGKLKLKTTDLIEKVDTLGEKGEGKAI